MTASEMKQIRYGRHVADAPRKKYDKSDNPEKTAASRCDDKRAEIELLRELREVWE